MLVKISTSDSFSFIPKNAAMPTSTRRADVTLA
ncbi:hypothetical protein RO3G_11923 [Rhizopus delemar RA 99-880]|uniref:Uncharacterized protein n=1 Tax=Rhizopus delemar (strain RA 99-880 / ATCC MYA-4621 / FGSC 9543 / NRRL 43880) TaxID=246409 RepID=I1CFI2_RHIO9|nr:hypothetical protein RO3G_11923 [Rhizopus delemar RA 99-880]|eukprot:EIE87212.1 hypothetical protein RO3G_11923 [Rhizopus delemar RA 99-880]